MDIPPLSQILSSLDAAIADFEATATLATSEVDRKILTASAADLRGIREQIAKEVPDNLQAFHDLMQQRQADAERLAAEIATQQAKLADLEAAAAAKAAAAEAAAAVPPAPPDDPKIDHGLGAALRSDLLAKLFPEAQPAAPFDPGRDIWQDWK